MKFSSFEISLGESRVIFYLFCLSFIVSYPEPFWIGQDIISIITIIIIITTTTTSLALVQEGLYWIFCITVLITGSSLSYFSFVQAGKLDYYCSEPRLGILRDCFLKYRETSGLTYLHLSEL